MAIKQINYLISNIIPYEEYNYEIETLSSNWPIKIYPLSGTIVSTSNSSEISSVLKFCNGGLCNNFQSPNLERLPNEQPFAKLRIKLTSDNIDNNVFTSPFNITCEDCFPIPSISFENTSIQLQNKNFTDLSIEFKNLKPYTSYTYVFNDVLSNYPGVLSNIPKSGTFMSSSGNSYTIKTNFSFCYYDACSSPAFGSGYIDKVHRQQCEKYFNNFNVDLYSDYLSFPIKSEIVSIECDDCLPKTTLSSPNIINLDSKTLNNYTLTMMLNNLKPHTKYDYNFNLINFNHKVSFSSLSGYFNSQEDGSKVLETEISFCESDEICKYTYTTGQIESNNCIDNKFINLNFELNSSCLENSLVSDLIKINCIDCLPKTIITSPAQSILNKTSGNIYDFKINASGLKPYSEYFYSFNNVNSNHLVGLKQLSGVVKTKNNTSATIANSLIFCESSGYCNSYFTNGSANTDVCNNLLFADFDVELNSSCLSQPVVSDKIHVECDNCLPVVSINTPPKAILTAPSGNVRNFNVAVTGLKPYSEYFYSFNNVNSNHLVGLKQLSGVVKTKNNTSATIANSLIFCESSGYCNSYFTNGSANTDVCNNLLFADFDVELNSSCLSQPVVSDKIHVECDNCLPKISISWPNDTINLKSTNLVTITGNISGLKPNNFYSYYFNGNSTWPLYVDNISGNLISTNNLGTATVSSKILFCSPSGICKENDNVLPYSIKTKLLNDSIKNGKLRLYIKSLSCNDIEYVSPELTINCDECLPKQNVPIIKIN